MSPNYVRIIGGQWRSRRLSFPPIPGLRPTPDRVRETLFNWLAPYIHGARCLDVFSGSGAMGFEALSRGASHSVMLDNSRPVADALIKNAQLLKTSGAEIHCVDSLNYLAQTALQPFDIVFLDPPYSLDIWKTCLNLLVKHRFLKPGSLIYIEDNKPITDIEGLKKHKESKASSVYYVLFLMPDTA